MAANYQETYIINATVQALCDVIRNPGFANQLKITIRAEAPTPSGMWYKLYHGTSMSSWGENITVDLMPVGANVTQVHIRSECDMPTQIIDWGKNKEMVHSIHQYLETYVNRNPLMQNNMQAPPMQVPPMQAQPMQGQPVQAPPMQSAGAFCARCGATVNKGANFCAVCGARLN